MSSYKPKSKTIGANSAKSGEVIDEDYSITSMLNPGISTRKQYKIKLSINGSIADTIYISKKATENITTLAVTIRKKL